MADPLPSFQIDLIPSNSTIIVGLSGGPDSVCLLHYLQNFQKKLNIKLIAVHLNHQWHQNSKNAARSCQKLCNELGVELVVKKSSELKFNAKWNGSKEELGRKMRRACFQEVANQYQASAIALAHHQNDQHETFFIRLLRGSSLTGLTGMKPQDGIYIRPLLKCSKQDILSYLDQHMLDYFTDPTNESDDFLRNRIRNHVIPALKQTDTRFDSNLHKAMHHLTEVDDFLKQTTHQTWKALTTEHGINITKLLELHPVMQQQLLLNLFITSKVPCTPSQKFFNEIMRFLHNNKSNRHEIITDYALFKKQGCLSIVKIEKTL